MHEREFRAFVLIAETGRMDVAARKLGYSQPAITYQVKRLEESLGYKLFTRHPTGARLTGDGRMILPSVRAVLLLIDSMRDAQGSRSDQDQDLERNA
ncbi:LysR family transcriptional regulator [Streptomyces fungicidicus]|uniref:LysR family transcriptional regulator n=1 Tax=Streptomyces fungicidicus TaxID=68203 RepID=UPI0036AAE83C